MLEEEENELPSNEVITENIIPEEDDHDDESSKKQTFNEEYDAIKKKLILPRHALHAAGLKFKHPKTGKEMVFETPLPDDLRSFFEGITGKKLQEFKTKRWGQ